VTTLLLTHRRYVEPRSYSGWCFVKSHLGSVSITKHTLTSYRGICRALSGRILDSTMAPATDEDRVRPRTLPVRTMLVLMCLGHFLALKSRVPRSRGSCRTTPASRTIGRHTCGLHPGVLLFLQTTPHLRKTTFHSKTTKPWYTTCAI
jgi:hypothetical protein